jgi:hypothetical protein
MAALHEGYREFPGKGSGSWRGGYSFSINTVRSGAMEGRRLRKSPVEQAGASFGPKTWESALGAPSFNLSELATRSNRRHEYAGV